MGKEISAWAENVEDSLNGLIMINKELLEILACPVCKGNITEITDKLLCNNCYRAYPVVENIPVMLSEESEILTKEEAEKLLK